MADEPAGAPEAEWARLQEAIAGAREDLQAAQADIAARASAAEADIFVAHLAMLEDPALLDPARREIDGGASAGRAWQAATDAAAAAYREEEDAFLRERAVDVEDVAARVLARLAGERAPAALDGAGILLADELTPGDAAGLDPALVRGIATARGGATAHAAILARALGIPAVVGLGAALLAVADGTELALDGEEGAVDVAPAATALADLEARRRTAEAAAAEALARAQEPAATRDGTRVEVVANVGSAAEVRPALAQGAEGIGLLRTEFLFLDRADPPDEDEQVAVLREIAAALEGRPLVVRTLDAGADKPLPFLAQAPEDNPFLGVRGIRLSLARPDLFDTQLRAIVRVAAEHRLAVMFPMVAALDELLAARERLDAARAALGLDPPLEVGVMVEVPGLALAAERVAPARRLLLRGHQRPRPVHDGRRAGERRARAPARRPAAAGARADRRGVRRRRGARALGRRVRRARRRPRRRHPPRRPRRPRALDGGEPDPRGQGGPARDRSRRGAGGRAGRAGGGRGGRGPRPRGGYCGGPGVCRAVACRPPLMTDPTTSISVI